MSSSTAGIFESLRRAGILAGVNAVYFSGLGSLPRAYARLRNGRNHRAGRVWPFAVLLYHRINSEPDPYFPGLATNVFAAQMSYLAKNFTVVSLSRLLDQIDQRIGVQQRTVAITFDDGYRDNYLYAHPILKRYDLPAAVFVATGYTDALRVMWNDRIADAIKRTSRRVIHVELPGESLRFTLDSHRGKLAALALILERLKNLPEAQKNLVVDDVIRQLGCATCGSDRLMLDWTELRAMVRSGWEVGSHTVEHRILTKVSTAETATELTDSKTALEQHLQIPITTFAYPNGKQQDFDERVKNSVRAAGYRAALTTVSGLNMDGLDPFEIKRISPWEKQLSRFAVKLEWMFWNSAKP